MSSPQAAAASLQQRVAIAQFGEQNYQVPAIVPLSKADRLGVAAAIGSGRAEAANAFALLQAMPENMLRATLEDKTIKDAITGGALSMDPARFNAAMKGLDQLSAEGMAGISKQFGDETKHRFMTWQSNYRYLGPEQMAEELKRYPDQKLRREAEKPALTEANKRSADDIVKAFDTSWPVTPAFIASNITESRPFPPTDEGTIAALGGDYNTIFIRRYRNRDLNGDADQAHSQTIELMRERWSRSNLNGGKLMLQSPESKYPVDGSHEWMRMQLETQLTERFGPRYGGGSVDRAVANLVGPAPQGPNWSYTLVTDRTTEAEATSTGQVLSEFDRRLYKPPVSYQVIVTNHKTGRTDMVRDEGQRPMRFRSGRDAAQGARGIRRGARHA